ncbi:ABC transporter substrate-binding protein [Celerinatantimonas yamalensis]|uniref:ABC transporter substrate-binding protein n=1 Tax=Celerinatantimonas yamalensis TaxID=559956 RepID=A0ABW9G571_9GAMM
MKQMKLLPLALLVASCCVFAQQPKVLKFAGDSSPRNLDPIQSGTLYATEVVSAIYDTLYQYKYLQRPYQLEPDLAAAMPQISKDGLTYTFTIKKGVHFANDPAFANGKGREVTAQDFVYSIERNFDPKNRSQGTWLWSGKIVGLDQWAKDGADYNKPVTGLKALNRYTIQIKLTQPYPQLMYSLAMPFSSVVPKEAVDKYGKEFAIHPVGSGPFELVSTNTTKTVLVRNPNYRHEVFHLKQEGYNPKTQAQSGVAELDGKTLPIVDRVEISWIPEISAAWNSFTKGNEVVNAGVSNQYMDQVLASRDPVKLKPAFAKKYHYRVKREEGFVYNTFNFNDPNLGYSKDPKVNAQNKALRCAIIKSFNWPQRINRFYMGMGHAYPGFIVPGTNGYDPKLSKASVTQDIAGAKKLLKQYGWNKHNLPMIIYPSTATVEDRQFYEQFRGNLLEIGYPKNKIKMKTYATFGDFNRDLTNSKTMMAPMGWSLDYPDAQDTLQLFYGPFHSPGANAANYNNPKYNALYEKSASMQPSPERTAIYKEMNKILINDCVGIGSFSRTGIALWHKNVVMWPNAFAGNIFKYIDIK